MPAELDEVLDRANPCREGDLDTHEITEALGDLHRSIKVAPTSAGWARLASVGGRRLRRRIAAAVTAAIAGSALVLASPAAADWVSLHTGAYDVADGQPKTPDLEMWREGSPEAAEKLRSYAREYGMAPGYSIEPMVEKYAQSQGEKAAIGFRTSVLGWSLCSWTETWVAADRRGDHRTAQAAVVAIRANADHEQALGYFPERAAETRGLADAAESGRRAVIIRWNSSTCEPVDR